MNAPRDLPTPAACLAYGALGLPLACAALPIYVHVPKLYAQGLALPLAAVGGVLLVSRVVDALSDPLIGWVSDRWGNRRGMIVAGLPLLALGLPALLAPPKDAGLMWLGLWVTVVTLGYSMATIAYNAWGAEAAPTPEGRLRLVANREGFALAGVVLAAALPGLLGPGGREQQGLAYLALGFVPLLVGLAAWTLVRAPRPAAVVRMDSGFLKSLSGVWAYRPLARLLAVFAANGIAAAIPSATVLFFVADVLRAEYLGGLFLAAYFLAAAASLPLWVAVARRWGPGRGWLAGMGVAVSVFAWAATLGAGDELAFGVVCLLSGVALGADLALPPTLLANLVAGAQPAGGVRAGACFGWWNLLTKANLALAAGVALPLLAALGYAPGDRGEAAVAALSLVYALVPVALKLLAMGLLWRWRADLATRPGAPMSLTTGACAP